MTETTKLVLAGIGIIFVMWLYKRKRIRKPVFLEIILIGISVFLTCRWWGGFLKQSVFRARSLDIGSPVLH
jgi:hypothetical protein